MSESQRPDPTPGEYLNSSSRTTSVQLFYACVDNSLPLRVAPADFCCLHSSWSGPPAATSVVEKRPGKLAFIERRKKARQRSKQPKQCLSTQCAHWSERVESTPLRFELRLVRHSFLSGSIYKQGFTPATPERRENMNIYRQAAN